MYAWYQEFKATVMRAVMSRHPARISLRFSAQDHGCECRGLRPDHCPRGCACTRLRSADDGDAALESGNYLALTCTVRATSQAQLDALYRELTAHPMVKVVL
jgi:hypothetical protein